MRKIDKQVKNKQGSQQDNKRELDNEFRLEFAVNKIIAPFDFIHNHPPINTSRVSNKKRGKSFTPPTPAYYNQPQLSYSSLNH